MATERKELSSDLRNLIVRCHQNQCELPRILNIFRSNQEYYNELSSA